MSKECMFMPGDKIKYIDSENEMIFMVGDIIKVHHCTYSVACDDWFVHETSDEKDRHWQWRFELHEREVKFDVKINY